MASWRFSSNPLVREGAPLLGLYWLYSTIRWFVARDSPFEAFENAYKIIQLEEQIGVFHEPTIQSWLVEHAMGFVQIANTFYTVGYFPILIVCGVLLYRFQFERFQVFKLTFLLTLGFALFCFSVFPLAPPRMLPEFGFVDTQQAYSDGFYNQKFVLSFYNPYAAMPSLHFGLAMLVGLVAYDFNRRTLKVFGMLYPGVMAVVIVTTAHHYFSDIAGGGIAVGLAYGIVKALPHVVKQPYFNPISINSSLPYREKFFTLWRSDKPASHHLPHWAKKDRDYVAQEKLRSTITAWLYRWRSPL
jgi:hypothetical protein